MSSLHLILIHPNGNPVGVFTSSQEFFDESLEENHVERFREFVRSKPESRDWDEWADSLASKTSLGSNIFSWNLYPHRKAHLSVVLEHAQDDTDW